MPVSPTRLVFLTALTDPKFRLLQPIQLDVEMGEGGEVIVSDRRVCNYGAGATLQEALDDYQSMLVDLYAELAESEDILSRSLRERLDDLRALMTPR